jgi:hypothetical protein
MRWILPVPCFVLVFYIQIKKLENMNKQFSLVAIGAATIAATQALLALPVGAVDALSDIEVGIPDVIYLKTFSKFVCNFPEAAINTDPGNSLDQLAGTATIDTTAAVGSISKDVNDATNFGTSPYTVNAQFCDTKNAFAVWGTGGSNGNIKVDVAKGISDTGTGPGTGNTLLLTAVNVSTGNTALATAITTGNLPAPGLATPTPGNIRLKFNLAGAKRSGNYTGVKFKITATSN